MIHPVSWFKGWYGLGGLLADKRFLPLFMAWGLLIGLVLGVSLARLALS